MISRSGPAAKFEIIKIHDAVRTSIPLTRDRHSDCISQEIRIPYFGEPLVIQVAPDLRILDYDP